MFFRLRLWLRSSTVASSRTNRNVLHPRCYFLSKYGKLCKDSNSELQVHGGGNKTAGELYDALIASIEKVYEEVIIDGGVPSNQLYLNPLDVVDGPCYAFVVHGKGPAVNGFGDAFLADESTTSSNVLIEGNTIKDLTCW